MRGEEMQRESVRGAATSNASMRYANVKNKMKQMDEVTVSAHHDVDTHYDITWLQSTMRRRQRGNMGMRGCYNEATVTNEKVTWGGAWGMKVCSKCVCKRMV